MFAVADAVNVDADIAAAFVVVGVIATVVVAAVAVVISVAVMVLLS